MPLILTEFLKLKEKEIKVEMVFFGDFSFYELDVGRS